MGKREAKLFQIAYSIAIVLSLVKISEANRIRTRDLSIQVESATQTTTPSTPLLFSVNFEQTRLMKTAKINLKKNFFSVIFFILMIRNLKNFYKQIFSM